MATDSGEEVASGLAQDLRRLAESAAMRAAGAWSKGEFRSAQDRPVAPDTAWRLGESTYVVRAEYDDEARRDAVIASLRDQGVDVAPWDFEGEERRGIAIVTRDWASLANAAEVAAARTERPYSLETQARDMQAAADAMSRDDSIAPEASLSRERALELAR